MVVAVSAPTAHADTFTYDFTSTTAGSAEFTESSILTSTTTISSFTSDTFSNLLSLLLAPESGGTCGFLAPGPCIAVSTGGGGTSFYYFSSNLTSTGTYDTNSNGFSGTLEISEVSTAPAPSSVALMLLGVGLVFVMRKRGHQLAT